MGASNNITINDLQILGKRDYDINFDWAEPHPTNPLHLTIVHFISTNKINCQPALLQPPSSATDAFPLAAKQKLALDLILAHYTSHQTIPPLHMIIQGTAGTGKSYLIQCIRKELNLSTTQEHNPLLVLAPTGVSAYNIQTTTIHATLLIPLRDMQPLTGQSLMFFQEQYKQLQYILIDEMSFLGPKLLLKIDSRLRQAFPHQQHEPFGGISVILVGDLGQLPLVMDKPLYASHSTTLALWHSFQTVVTLDTSFRQQGTSNIQQFCAILQNIRNANALQTDWKVLMSRSSTKLAFDDNKQFDCSIHLFATNVLAKHHNTKMLKQLHLPVAQLPRQTSIAYDNDEQLLSEILLSLNEKVMLIANLWIQVSLVNGSLGQMKSIVYDTYSKPPDLPKYVVVEFKNYTGPHWDNANPKFVPTTPITRGSHTQLTLAMAWAVTIHKSQGLTLDKATIDIGKTKKQGLTFTTISRVKSLQDLRIDPPFTFERYSKLQSNAYTTIRKKEENRLATLSNQISSSHPDHPL
ncbi:uncharacterized protein LOC131873572 [Cryptomeria japonica]|uniref:uncharacterized protein LOC131873572 n=1 Tax=Cryptomeria japonica TaxID=3369 RepID=UPI0027DA810B|nr:uncharacterized protein LOC131873572 [Cryptomeria japonica]